MADIPRDVADIDPSDSQALEDWATRFLVENRRLTDDWPEPHKAVVRYLRDHPGASAYEIASALKLETAAAAEALAALVTDGWLIRCEGGYLLKVELTEPDAFLTESQLLSAKRKEIYNRHGVPEPEIVAGIFNRSHPGGRKINSDYSRKKHGAPFYRN